MYPGVFLHSSFIWRFLIEAELTAMLKITKWFNVFWHPRIYWRSHLLFSLITSSFNPNLLHTHFMPLKFHRAPNSKANSDNQHLLLKLFSSLAPSNMLNNGISTGEQKTAHQQVIDFKTLSLFSRCMTETSVLCNWKKLLKTRIAYFTVKI